jgi:hypothetical protein
MTVVNIDNCGKGINFDLLPTELELGVWSDGQNFRFRNGFAETFEGGTALTLSAGKPWWMHLYETSADRYLVTAELGAGGGGGGTVKAQQPGGTVTDITRLSDAVDIASITRVGTTATLTTVTNHGRSTGNSVTVYGALPSQYNGTYSITVTSPTVFTYTMASDPGASASPVGAFFYGSAAVSPFTNTLDQPVTGGVLGGVLLINNPVDGLYYWNGNTGTRIRKFPGSYVASVGRPFNHFIVQLAPTISGVTYPHDVIWSNSAEPGSIPTTFAASQANDAGRQPLADTLGPLVDCLPLGDANIVYKRDARYAMRHIGGNEVFSFTKLPGNDGLYQRNCVVDTPRGHVFLTQNRDVMLHQGGEAVSIASKRVRDFLRANISPFIQPPNFLVVNPSKNEVWVCLSQGYNGVAIVLAWNWVDDTWGVFSFEVGEGSPTCGASGYWGTSWYSSSDVLIMADTAGNGYNVNPTADGNWGAYPFTCFLVRTGITLDDRSTFKTLHGSRWHIDASSSQTFSATVQHGSAPYADGAPTYATAATYTYSSDAALRTKGFANSRATAGPYLAVKFTVPGTSKMKLRSFDLDITGGGKR